MLLWLWVLCDASWFLEDEVIRYLMSSYNFCCIICFCMSNIIYFLSLIPLMFWERSFYLSRGSAFLLNWSETASFSSSLCFTIASKSLLQSLIVLGFSNPSSLSSFSFSRFCFLLAASAFLSIFLSDKTLFLSCSFSTAFLTWCLTDMSFLIYDPTRFFESLLIDWTRSAYCLKL